MKKVSSYIFLIFSVLLLTITLFPKKSRAIPPFAEKYHFACAVCHTVFPNLNPFGRAFWRNGFRLPNTTGTPADATSITEGLSLPNPWPVPLSVATWIQYTHATNENVLPQTLPMVGLSDNNTDNFSVSAMIDSGGAFKLNSPFTDSLSYFVMNNIGATTGNNVPFTNAQTWASLNDLGYGFGIKPHLLNLKIGEPNTAGPYFYRQMPMFLPSYSDMNAQGLSIGFDEEGGKLINHVSPGFEFYGTPGYNLWYKFTVTNDQGASSSGMNMGGMTPSSPITSNAMTYSYSLKEYLQLKNGGQLEFGYYGATVSEPVQGNQNWALMGNGMSSPGVSTVWINPIRVDGFDIDYAFPGYMSEVGLTAMHQEDFHPYGNPSLPSQELCLPQNNTPVWMTMMNGTLMNGFPGDVNGACPAGYSSYGTTNSSNGYSTIDVYAMASFMNNMYTGLMLMAEYSVYRWDHKALQEAYNFDYNSMSKTQYFYNSLNLLGNAGSELYQNGFYANNSGVMNEGVDQTLTLTATYNIAYNAYLYATYLLTDRVQDDMFGTGLAFAF